MNFGVFKLYGDPALNNVLEMFIKLLLSAGLKEIMVGFFYIFFLTSENIYFLIGIIEMIIFVANLF